jgi:hypothetical protein
MQSPRTLSVARVIHWYLIWFSVMGKLRKMSLCWAACAKKLMPHFMPARLAKAVNHDATRVAKLVWIARKRGSSQGGPSTKCVTWSTAQKNASPRTGMYTNEIAHQTQTTLAELLLYSWRILSSNNNVRGRGCSRSSNRSRSRSYT